MFWIDDKAQKILDAGNYEIMRGEAILNLASFFYYAGNPWRRKWEKWLQRTICLKHFQPYGDFFMNARQIDVFEKELKELISWDLPAISKKIDIKQRGYLTEYGGKWPGLCLAFINKIPKKERFRKILVQLGD